MQNQVIFRDNQELQAADFNNMQTFTADTLRDLVHDAVSDGTHYAGFDVVASGATELTIAQGRLYKAGQVHVSPSVETMSLFAHLPLVTERIVTVVLWGSEIETQVEPRDFLIDPEGDATEPRAVAMQRMQRVVIDLVPGVESADPQPPATLPGVLALAHVRLGTTGVVEVVMQTANRLPSATGNAQAIGALTVWQKSAEPRIGSLATDLAALGERTSGLPDRRLVMEMAADIARLKEKADLPEVYAAYAADYFGDDSESDPGAAGYNARVENGLSFPVEAISYGAIQLFNPFDANVKRENGGNVILPAYTEAARLTVDGYAGDVPLNQYPAYPVLFGYYGWSWYYYHYGWHWNYYGWWYNRYWWSYYGYGWYSYSAYRYWMANQTSPSADPATENVNGSMTAQTFLVANAMWLTSVGLNFTAIAAAGDVHLAVCETAYGKPDTSKTLARVTLARADIKPWPLETRVPIGPVQLEAGKRYALVLVTPGAHRLAVTSGARFTQGTLFYGTDGDYVQGDLTRDLMFTLYAASFTRTRVEVPLTSAALAGGITDLALAAKQVIPNGTELAFEIQVGGIWRPLGDGLDHLAVKPDLLPVRAVFLGTSDMMPALTLSADGLTASRPAQNLSHVSAARVLAADSTDIEVRVLVGGWDAGNHTLSCKLVVGGGDVNPTTTVTREEDGATRFVFRFAPAATSSYVIKLTGTRAPTSAPFTVLERTDVAF